MAATSIAHRRRISNGYFEKYIKGQGVDMGCGDDPVLPDSIPYDIQYGKDAENPDDIPNESLDYVFSSHCLEHLRDPWRAVSRWWDLVKPGGHLIISVPDWILYENKQWPSRYNTDHKWRFAMFKTPGMTGLIGSPDDLLVFSDLFEKLPRCQIRSYLLCDTGFNYREEKYDRTWHTGDAAEAEIEIICRKLPSDFWSPDAE